MGNILHRNIIICQISKEEQEVQCSVPIIGEAKTLLRFANSPVTEKDIKGKGSKITEFMIGSLICRDLPYWDLLMSIFNFQSAEDKLYSDLPVESTV